jgi:hypothetical protein
MRLHTWVLFTGSMGGGELRKTREPRGLPSRAVSMTHSRDRVTPLSSSSHCMGLWEYDGVKGQRRDSAVGANGPVASSMVILEGGLYSCSRIAIHILPVIDLRFKSKTRH